MAEIGDGSVPRRSLGVVQADVDGDLVLLSPRDFSYFGALGAGPEVWALVDGSRTIGEIVEALAQRFDGTPAQIRAEVVDFIDATAAVGLIEIT